MRVQSSTESFQTFLDNNFDSSKKFLERDEEYALIMLAKVELLQAKDDPQGSPSPTPGFDELLACNYRLILKSAKRFARQGFEIDDLFQEGVLGFKRAIEKFDFEKGFRLTTYAIQWIESKIGRYISGHDDTIYLPNHLARHTSAMRSKAREVFHKKGRRATDEELVSALNLKGMSKCSQRTTTKSALGAYHLNSVSADQAIGMPDGGKVRILDRFESEPEKSPFELVFRERRRQKVRRILRRLTRLERGLIKLRMHDRCLDRCAEILFRAGFTKKKVSGEWLRQIEERTLRKVKEMCLRVDICELE